MGEESGGGRLSSARKGGYPDGAPDNEDRFF
jgi:hypothetical protein